MQVKRNFGTEKNVLIQKYRFALEQALAKAEFLTKPDFTVVQAFMLFLVLVRRHDDTRFAWTLTALLIRLSQALGLHRDGTHFPSLTPYQIEMRRRLFWAVCVLDLRSAEDQGTDLTIVAGTFDTQIPLNINDSDISQESTSLPEPREGTTDMAFSLIRYEICALSRRLHTASSSMTPAYPGDAGKSLEEREALLTEVSERVQQRLLKDGSNAMFWVASNLTRVIVAKMTLIIYQPVLFPGPGHDVLSEDVRTRLLNAALDVFEYSHILNTDPRCKQWHWLFQTWSHWHALAYTLIEVSHGPWGPCAERAWAALNLTFLSPNPAELERLASHHAVWMPLRKLYLKVKKHREAEIARLQADPQAARELELRDQSKTPAASFGCIPNSVKTAIALDRWRKLVNLPALPQPTPPQLPQQSYPRLPERSQTMPVSLTQPDNSVFSRPELMEILDDAMANPGFVPTDLIPIWANDASDELARAAFFAYPSSEPPRVDPSLAFDSTPLPPQLQHHLDRTAAAAGMGLPAHLQQQQPQQVQQGTPMGGDVNAGGQVAATSEENLPPWLWPTTGSPDIMHMPYMSGGEDVDTNMDEGFDWQGWQESLGRYEVEANGGRAGSTWGAGL